MVLHPVQPHRYAQPEERQGCVVYFGETMDACVRPETVVSVLKAAGSQLARRIPLMGFFSAYAVVKA